MRGLILLTLVLLAAACRKVDAQPAEQTSACRQQIFENARFTICDPGRGRLVLFAAAKSEQPTRSVAEVGRRLGHDKVAFAMNAGMFDNQGRPIGLAIAAGKQKQSLNRRKGGGNFHLMPNGVFVVRRNGEAAVVTSANYEPSAAIQLATQSGPMLVIGGKLHPAFEPDGASRLIRNGVGVRDGHALFVISEDPVSFGRFARFFRDGLKTPNALSSTVRLARFGIR